METRTKRKILFAGGALTLAAALAGAFGWQPGVSGHTAAPAAGVRAQRVDLANPSPDPDRSVTLKVKNFGAFTGGLCLVDSNILNDCTPDLNVLQPPTELHSTVLTPPDRPNQIQVEGFAQGGDNTTLLVPVQMGPLCFRLDGTTFVNFSFKQVNCADL